MGQLETLTSTDFAQIQPVPDNTTGSSDHDRTSKYYHLNPSTWRRQKISLYRFYARRLPLHMRYRPIVPSPLRHELKRSEIPDGEPEPSTEETLEELFKMSFSAAVKSTLRQQSPPPDSERPHWSASNKKVLKKWSTRKPTSHA
ncbi:hypothetical protein VTI74DRAFT_9516 [Chaetomium olivicolor]